MKKVITYGTFDLFHEGHLNLLKRARALGDFLIVGVTGSAYDFERGKLNVQQTVSERIKSVENSGLADQIIVEEHEGQKVHDVQKYGIDVFTVGSDWEGKFDYLKEFCDVIYLPRTPGVSSTEVRLEKAKLVRLGIIGHGRIAKRFISEAKFVSGVEIVSVLGRKLERVRPFAIDNSIEQSYEEFDEFIDTVDAVYIASPHDTHFPFALSCLEVGRHVLVEKPMCFSEDHAKALQSMAEVQGLVLMEAVKTAYCPGFIRLINAAKSHHIGKVRHVDATFTKLIPAAGRELSAERFAGAFAELATYPLLVAAKIFGTEFKDIRFVVLQDEGGKCDLFVKFELIYSSGVFGGIVGLGVKSEGDLRICGESGYIYAPAPWWLTEYFEIRREDPSAKKKFAVDFQGDGLRYELAAFVSRINGHGKEVELSGKESLFFARVFQCFFESTEAVTLQ